MIFPLACALLLFSGFSGLVYQVAWLRLLRHVFGASTAASAAVLAVLMGGLGAGALVLGRRADASAQPLRFYGVLELGVAVSAAATPWLVEAARAAYVALGGSLALGQAGAAAVRIALTALVLGAPAFLMGGTVPALARAVEHEADAGRRRTGALYAFNTIGAVAGAALATFALLEALGTRGTIFAAAAVSLVAGLAALLISRTGADGAVQKVDEKIGIVSPVSILVLAALVGFAFMAMELVWYRMLAPLLGGSSYTFGLVLAVALAGIGAGGGIYALGRAARRPSMGALAATCALEALCLVAPYAAGDRVALAAIHLRAWGEQGFLQLAAGWSVVAAAVVLPAAVVAGYQFPLLIALAGEGRARVGAEAGRVYAWNTAGAIAGSLAGGFLLVPFLGATRAWVGIALLLVGAAAALVLVRTLHALALLAGAAAVALAFAEGPTAFWRHEPIGAGRVPVPAGENAYERARRDARRAVRWERDGLESAVALQARNDLALLLNGKSDGSARADAATAAMLALVPATLHPAPKRAMVVGLGTGGTSGWLTRLPGMERVDTVELEPAVVEAARAFRAVNFGVLENPRSRVVLGDAREVLQITRDLYDLVVSEPSNPYRAGVASLFTVEFYRAVRERLAPGGLFGQWLQAYEIDEATGRTVLATLGAVFPHVEAWELTPDADLLLVASAEPLVHDLSRVRARASEPPLRDALRWTQGVAGAEGFYAGYVGRPAAREGAILNKDDRPVVEFAAARSVGRAVMLDLAALRREGRALQVALDPALVDAQRRARRAHDGEPLDEDADLLATLEHLRVWPWASAKGMLRALERAVAAVHSDAGAGLALFRALEKPFALNLCDEPRLAARLQIAEALGDGALCLEAFAPLGPHVPWEREVLAQRAACYRRASAPRAAQAEDDLFRFDRAR